MADWTSGYVADVGYTYGYYPELNPARARLALLARGLAAPQIRTACELGFGQGVSLAAHASASDVDWWGTDFNPAHTAFAQQLAAAGGGRAHLFDEAFADFVQRKDLPDFDFIGLHGIWSWISEDNRRVIVDFLRRKLRPGGVLYLSYNAMPGWAPFLPVRQLLNAHAESLSLKGASSVAKFDSALAFVERLIAAQPLYLAQNPQIAGRLEQMRSQDRHYLAHEYLNRDWEPMAITNVAEQLQPAKLSFAASAHFADHVSALNVDDAQAALVADISDPLVRELTRDLMINQQFRRDYWVRGARTLPGAEQQLALAEFSFVLVTPAAEVSLAVRTPRGECQMQPEIYQPLLDALADHRPRSLGELVEEGARRGASFAQILEACLVLLASNQLAVVERSEPGAELAARVARFNRYAGDQARLGGDLQVLASPLLGGAAPVSRIEQLFLAALEAGEAQPAAWAASAWRCLSSQGQKILKDGVALETVEANIAELERQAQAFSTGRLPILRGLRAVAA